MSAGKSKVMVFERQEYDKIGCGKMHNVREESEMKCRIRMREEMFQAVKEFKCLGSVICKNNSIGR